jgi:hypothetical protein
MRPLSSANQLPNCPDYFARLATPLDGFGAVTTMLPTNQNFSFLGRTIRAS